MLEMEVRQAAEGRRSRRSWANSLRCKSKPMRCKLVATINKNIYRSNLGGKSHSAFVMVLQVFFLRLHDRTRQSPDSNRPAPKVWVLKHY